MSEAMLPLLVGFVMAFGGVYLIYRAVLNLAKARDVKFWPVAPGTITKLALEGLGPKIIGASGLYEYKRYIVSLLYTYQVDGASYTGDQFFFGSDITVTQDVEKICAQFKQGDDVSVYYNTADPAESVLLRENPLKKHGDLWGGVVVTTLYEI